MGFVAASLVAAQNAPGLSPLYRLNLGFRRLLELLRLFRFLWGLAVSLVLFLGAGFRDWERPWLGVP